MIHTAVHDGNKKEKRNPHFYKLLRYGGALPEKQWGEGKRAFRKAFFILD